MSPAAQAETAAPQDPAVYRTPGRRGVGLWAVIAFGLLCVVAGAALWALMPSLLARRPAPPTAPSLAVEPARPAPAAAPEPLTVPATVAEPAPNPQVERLDARVAALETQAARTTHAAAAALAAAALVEASQAARPFPEEVAALRQVSPASPDLDQLARLADGGAPTRASLAASFPDYAARAASAARKPGEGAPLGDRIVYALSQVVMVRRVGEVAGEGPDAQLARADRFVEDGDFDRAFAALDKLPPAAREAVAPWRIRAERRAEIDRYAASLRARALQELAAASRSGGA